MVEMNVTLVLASLVCIILGLFFGFIIRHIFAQKDFRQREKKGDEIINKAKAEAKEINYKARREAKNLINNEKDQFSREVKKKERSLQEKDEGLDKEKEGLKNQKKQLESNQKNW